MNDMLPTQLSGKATKEYFLLRGKHIYRDSNGKKITAKPGDKVPLTADQFKLFKNKFSAKDPKVDEEAKAEAQTAAEA
jgi:hypothetical protein